MSWFLFSHRFVLQKEVVKNTKLIADEMVIWVLDERGWKLYARRRGNVRARATGAHLHTIWKRRTTPRAILFSDCRLTVDRACCFLQLDQSVVCYLSVSAGECSFCVVADFLLFMLELCRLSKVTEVKDNFRGQPKCNWATEVEKLYSTFWIVKAWNIQYVCLR